MKTIIDNQGYVEYEFVIGLRPITHRFDLYLAIDELSEIAETYKSSKGFTQALIGYLETKIQTTVSGKTACEFYDSIMAVFMESKKKTESPASPIETATSVDTIDSPSSV